MIGIWAMSKTYSAPGGTFPLAWSYGHNHMAFGAQDNGWTLVYLTLDAHQYEFLLAGVDPGVEVIGTEWAEPTKLLLDTYKDMLPAGKSYNSLGHVLNELGKRDPRFIEHRRPDKW